MVYGPLIVAGNLRHLSAGSVESGWSSEQLRHGGGSQDRERTEGEDGEPREDYR